MYLDGGESKGLELRDLVVLAELLPVNGLDVRGQLLRLRHRDARVNRPCADAVNGRLTKRSLWGTRLLLRLRCSEHRPEVEALVQVLVLCLLLL